MLTFDDTRLIHSGAVQKCSLSRIKCGVSAPDLRARRHARTASTVVGRYSPPGRLFEARSFRDRWTDSYGRTPARPAKSQWGCNTVQDFATANGVPAHAGSLNGPGAVVLGGIVYVNSGYIRFGEAPGNVLLAFSAFSANGP